MSESKKSPGNRTEKIALAVAAVVLVVLAASKYTDYLEKKLESEIQASQETSSAVEQIAAERRIAEAALNERLARLEASIVASQQPVQPPADPKAQRIEDLKEELDAVQKEREVMDDILGDMAHQERINKLAGDRPPDAEVGMTEQERMIRRSAAIATVTDFNKEWGFVMLDGGETRGLTAGTKLALRREGAVIGLLQVSDTEQTSCVANLVRGGPGGQGNAVPQKGDDVIAWPPY